MRGNFYLKSYIAP